MQLTFYTTPMLKMPNPETGEWKEVDIATMKNPIGIILVPHGHVVPLDKNKKKR